MLQYELCSYPTSLFDNNLRIRSADKANLLHALIKKAESSVAEEQPIAATVIIDGGSLLQRLPWPKCSLYSALCELYVQYIKRNFSTRRVTVVFDGYASGATTKDEAHHTRGGGADMMLRMHQKQAEIHQSSRFNIGESWHTCYALRG